MMRAFFNSLDGAVTGDLCEFSEDSSIIGKVDVGTSV